MNNDLTLLTEPQTAVEMEHRLATAMRGIGQRIAQRPDIVRGLDVATRLQSGLVIGDDTQAVEVADLVVQIIDAEKALEAGTHEALRIPNQMQAALRGLVNPVRDRLAAAKKIANDAQVTWKNTLRRRAAEEEARRRKEAEDAAREAARLAAERGDEDIPPPAEMAPVEVPRTVTAGTARVGTQVRVEPVEIISFAECPVEWLALLPAMARAAFSGAEKAGWVKRPAPGESIVYKGVRFEARETAVNRRA